MENSWTVNSSGHFFSKWANSNGHFQRINFRGNFSQISSVIKTKLSNIVHLDEFSRTFFVHENSSVCVNFREHFVGEALARLSQHCTVECQVRLEQVSKYLLDNSVTLFFTIKQSVHENSPEMSTRIHTKNVYENSPKKTYFRGQNVHNNSPKMSMRIHPFCP